MCNLHFPTISSCLEYVTKNFISAEIEGPISPDTIITGLCYDSRKVKTGNIFFCKGRNFSPEYLRDAIKNGAACIISPRKFSFFTESFKKNTLFIFIDNVREVMARFSAFFYGFPIEKMTSIAVTGTKGKTSTSQMIKDVLNGKRGIRAVLLRDFCDSSLTTPESPDLHRAAFEALQSGATHVICEISSQALKDLRTHGILFDIACFLNFSPDHISPSEHSCIEEYFLFKASLFLNCRRAVINISSPSGTQIAALCQKNNVPYLTFSAEETIADIYATDIRNSEKGCTFTAHTASNGAYEQLFLSSFGSYNTENAICTYAVSTLLRIDHRDIFRALAASKIAGRGEWLSSIDGKLKIIVDYAHNGLSFEKTLKEVRNIFPDRCLTVIFGCPGEKAFNRRYQLPEAALKYTDRIILSEDDSGKESFESIAGEMMKNIDGILSSYPEPKKTLKRASITIYKSREKAIESAIKSAHEGVEPSVIAILGRGDDKIMRLQSGNVFCKSDFEIAENTIKRINDRIALSSAFSQITYVKNKRLILALPNNKALIRENLASVLHFHSLCAALYCQSRYAPLIRDICYQNGRLCHICDPSSDFIRECDYCFRSGTIPVFLKDDPCFCSMEDLISMLSFDTAVYIDEKVGILIDGKTHIPELSYENAILINERTRTEDIASLTTALERGATEALLLNGNNVYSLCSYFCGGSICGTVVKKTR